MAKHTFNEGCMIEGNPWYIETDVHYGSYKGSNEKPCPHSQVIDKSHPRWDASATDNWNPVQWLVPRVVVAINDGGYSRTETCLNCILEAATSLEKETS